MIFEVNHKPIPHCCQRSVCCVKQSVRTHVIMRLNPFPFEHPPQDFSDVQMRGVWREEEYVHSSFLPYRTQCKQLFRPVDRCVVKHDDSLSPDGKGEVVKEGYHPSVSMLLTVVNQWVRQQRSTMAKQLSRAPRWDGT